MGAALGVIWELAGRVFTVTSGAIHLNDPDGVRTLIRLVFGAVVRFNNAARVEDAEGGGQGAVGPEGGWSVRVRGRRWPASRAALDRLQDGELVLRLPRTGGQEAPAIGSGPDGDGTS